MSEIISEARLRAMEYLEHESQEEVGESSIVEETFSEDQMEEVQQMMFEHIQHNISGIANDLAKNDWTTEVNLVPRGGFMEVAFKENEETFFEVVFSIGQHDEKKSDGIELSDLSFDTEGVHFNVTISSSVNDRIFKGIGSYRGVLEVTKRITDDFLNKHFIELYSQAGSEI